MGLKDIVKEEGAIKGFLVTNGQFAAPAAQMLDAQKLELAAPDAVALHCLPAHVGEEITADVLYGDRSLVWDQADNRLHVYKAVLALTVR